MPSRARKPSKRRNARGAPPLRANVAELRALAHPLRLRILELFAEAPRTTKKVAELLDQPPTRLYHHVAALERAGLLILKETRQNRGTVEKWYEAVTRLMGTSQQTAPTVRGKQARRAVAMTILEQARQEMLAPIRKGEEGRLLVRVVSAGSPELIAQIRQRLYAVVTDIQREYGCEDTAVVDSVPNDRWAITMAFAPVWPRAKESLRGNGGDT